MPKLSMEMKFPCGFEVKLKASSLFFTPSIDENDGLCPLHGKKCVKGGLDE